MTDRPHPTRWRYAGLAAAGVLAWASYGSGSRYTLHTAILWPGLRWQAATGGSPLRATISIVAMAALVLTWWRLRDAWVSVGWWQVTAALWFAPLIASVPLYSRDLYSYAAQGALWHEGLSPYEHGVRDLTWDWRDSTAPTWLDSPAPYGPLFLLLARGVAAVSGGHLLVALAVLRLVAVIAVVVIVWAVPAIASRLRADPDRAAWLGVAAPLLGAHFVSGAHNDALMVAGLLLAIALALHGRYPWAIVVIALATMVKVTAVVALPFIALLWAASRPPLSWRRVAGTAALSAGLAALPVAIVTALTGLGFSWLNPAATQGRNEQWTSLPTAVGIAIGAVGHVLGHPEWRDGGIGTMRALGAQRGFIRKLFIMETMIVTVAFGIVGILAGVILTLILHIIGISAPNDFMRLIFGGALMRPELGLAQALNAMAIMLFIALVSWIFPVRMALKVSPIKAIMSE